MSSVSMIAARPAFPPAHRRRITAIPRGSSAARRAVLETWDEASISIDLITRHLDEYESLVILFTGQDASAQKREFAYGRLLGVRGTLCRLCPSGATELLPQLMVRRWSRAESLLKEFLESHASDREVQAVINRVEETWIASAESSLESLVLHMRDAEVQRQLGLLKSIDSIALHLAQRQVFRKDNTVTLPLSSAHAVKLRMRLLALYIMLHSSLFEETVPIIRSYRETFRISDPSAYPWWFVDRRLTQRQLAWTYQRMQYDELAWRF